MFNSLFFKGVSFLLLKEESEGLEKRVLFLWMEILDLMSFITSFFFFLGGGGGAGGVELGHTFWVIGLFMPAFIEDRIKVNV